MFITHRTSPIPGSTCHATKCPSRSSSVTLVRFAVCVASYWLCVFMFPCTVGCVRDPCYTLNVPSLRSACLLNASVTLSRFFPLFINSGADPASPSLQNCPVHLWWWQKRKSFLLYRSRDRSFIASWLIPKALGFPVRLFDA